MKSILVLAAAFSAVGMAQLDGLLDGIPRCAMMCVNNLLGQAADFGCNLVDIPCLCGDSRFGWGVRDCVLEACDAEDQRWLTTGGINLCNVAGRPTSPSDATRTPSATSGGLAPTQTDDHDDDVVVHPIISTVTTGTLPYETTIGFTTITTDRDDDDDFTTITGTVTRTEPAPTHSTHSTSTRTVAETGDRTASHTPSGTATSTISGGYAALATAAPGLAGALGLAALFAM